MRLTGILYFLLVIASPSRAVERPLGKAPYADARLGRQVTFDLDRTSHRFDGFGAQVWVTNNNPRVDLERKLAELNIHYVRLTPYGATWPQMQSLRDITDRLGIQWVCTFWSAPPELADEHGVLQDVRGFTDWWMQQIDEMAARALAPHYIELMNEPDSMGHWSTGMAPSTYNEVVKALRRELDGRGLPNVGIVGPGLAHLDWDGHNETWIGALDREAVASIAAWSTHSWDDGDLCRGGASCIERQWPSFRRAFERQDAAKPVFVTEFGTKETTYNGVRYPHPGQETLFPDHASEPTRYYSATDTVAYAVRLFENSLALANEGANVPFIWQLVDEPSELLELRKSWGLVDLEGQNKPAFQAIATLGSAIPEDALVVEPPKQTADGLYAAAFIGGDAVVVAIANDTRENITSTIRLLNADDGLRIVESSAFSAERLGDPLTAEPDIARVTHPLLELFRGSQPGEYGFPVTLPRNSTLTVALGRRHLRAQRHQ